jgi:hypothetical protein
MNLYEPMQLVDSMHVVRKNTIAIAEDIPEAQYDYRPAPDSRSVPRDPSPRGFADVLRFSHSSRAKAHIDGGI